MKWALGHRDGGSGVVLHFLDSLEEEINAIMRWHLEWGYWGWAWRFSLNWTGTGILHGALDRIICHKRRNKVTIFRAI